MRRLAAALVLLALPPLFAAYKAAAFHVHNRNNGSIVSSGERREFLVYVPRGYDARKPVPLVISLHGAGGWPVQQRELSEWDRVADRHGFVVVYPSGADTPRIWHVEPTERLPRDVRFLSDLIDEMEADYHIDRDRIYVNGFSNGGGMSFAASCAMGDRVAAVGMVGAAQTLDWNWCGDRRPIPAIFFHGTGDTAAPYNGGPSWVSKRPFPSVAGWADKWRKRNRCGDAADSRVARDVVRREYSRCAEDVVLYTIEGGGHTWPGGGEMPEWFVGRTTRSIDASETMWQFFREHPLRRPRS